MTSYDFDPGLRTSSLPANAPELHMLDDGFSPPHHDIDLYETPSQASHSSRSAGVEEILALGPKSLF